MFQPRPSSRARMLGLCLGCVLLTTLYAPVVLAEHTVESHADDEVPPLNVESQADDEVPLLAVESQADAEVPPLALHAHQPKSRYAGWLLAAYLLPPALAVTGIAAESGKVMIVSAVLMWLAPIAVHLIAGEYALAGRASLVLAFAAAGFFVGALIGLGVGALIPEDQYTREEDPGLNRLIGASLGGVIGGLIGIGSWAAIDISEAFQRDAKRRQRAQRIAFGITPLPQGAAASLVATF